MRARAPRPIRPPPELRSGAPAGEAVVAWRGPRTFDALRDRNFRLFFGALVGTFTAMNMQMFIRGWLVFELTGDYEDLGLMSAANGVAGLLLSPLGGVIADRVRQKKHVVQVCQLVNASVALCIALLLATDALSFLHLVIAALVQGAAMTVMMPSRQALTPDVVGLDRLTNAIGLSTSGMNAARLAMPGLAGWMVGALGGGNGNVAPAQYVYFLMTGLYLWASLGLLLVRAPDRERELRVAPADETRSERWQAVTREALGELGQGVRYVGREPRIAMLLAVNFFMVFFGMTYMMLLPGFAKEVLGAGPERLGVLISVSGVGALVGSLIIASLPNRKRGLILLSSAGVLALALFAFSLSRSYWLSVGILVAVGLGQAGRMSLSNILVQSYVEDQYRGRVMSIYMLEFSLMSVSIYPIGVLANAVGPDVAVEASAVGLAVLVAGLFIFAPAYRRLE